MTVSKSAWARAKKKVLARDDGHCQLCWRTATDVHHRRPRGRGSTSDESIALGLANLVGLCRPCHDRIEQNRAYAYRRGWLVHSWDDPALVPFRAPWRWLVFNQDGTTRAATGKEIDVWNERWQEATEPEDRA